MAPRNSRRIQEAAVKSLRKGLVRRSNGADTLQMRSFYIIIKLTLPTSRDFALLHSIRLHSTLMMDQTTHINRQRVRVRSGTSTPRPNSNCGIFHQLSQNMSLSARWDLRRKNRERPEREREEERRRELPLEEPLRVVFRGAFLAARLTRELAANPI